MNGLGPLIATPTWEKKTKDVYVYDVYVIKYICMDRNGHWVSIIPTLRCS